MPASLILSQALWGDIKYATNSPDRMQRRQHSLDLLASKVDSERKATKDTLENDKDFVFHKQVRFEGKLGSNVGKYILMFFNDPCCSSAIILPQTFSSFYELLLCSGISRRLSAK